MCITINITNDLSLFQICTRGCISVKFVPVELTYWKSNVMKSYRSFSRFLNKSTSDRVNVELFFTL